VDAKNRQKRPIQVRYGLSHMVSIQEIVDAVRWKSYGLSINISTKILRENRNSMRLTFIIYTDKI
jgi:hypothetical protein